VICHTFSLISKLRMIKISINMHSSKIGAYPLVVFKSRILHYVLQSKGDPDKGR